MRWLICSIDTMANTKSAMRTQLSTSNIDIIVSSLAKLGATHVAISCPFDLYSSYTEPKPTVGYMQSWISSIRNHGMGVFFRNTWLNFEGLYGSPKYTPNSSPSITTGIAATVLNGTDTTSYLAKTYLFIKNNPSLFLSGDVWAPMTEPENQGVGADLSVNMFPDYTTLGQWLVDIKTVSDSAFSSIGVTDVITGMTSVNGGTVFNNSITYTYWSQIGKCVIDHYVSPDLYSSQLDTIYTNAGVDIYIGEWGTTAGSGGSVNDGFRSDKINKVLEVFNSKSYIKGVNYWQSVDSITSRENILDSSSFLTLQSSRIVQKYFQEIPRVLVN